MDTVRINKLELMKKVKENRKEHKEIFDEAMAGYKDAMTKHLNAMLEDVQAGKLIDHRIPLTQPVDHTKEYDTILTMLEMSVDKDVELTSHNFRQYVMDDWDWKDNFLHSNVRYSAKAAAMSR